MSDEQAVMEAPEEAKGGSAWKVIGIVVGVLLLICCGLGTWLVVQMGKLGAKFQQEATPIMLVIHRMKVTKYAQRTGELPETLKDSVNEVAELEGPNGNAQMNTDGQTVDVWGQELRLTTSEDGSFEVRSAGPDGTMDTEDDLTENGHRDDDAAVIKKRFKEATAAMIEKIKDTFPFSMMPMDEVLKELDKEGGGDTVIVIDDEPLPEDGAMPDDGMAPDDGAAPEDPAPPEEDDGAAEGGR